MQDSLCFLETKQDFTFRGQIFELDEPAKQSEFGKLQR
jgi:hypothetical protein